MKSEKFAQRLKSIMGDNSVNSFANKCELSESLMRQYLSGSCPGIDKAAKIAEAANVTLDWLIAGQGPMRPGQPAPATLDRATRSLAAMPPAAPKAKPSTGDMITKTIAVLDSETIFAAALAANIEAFHQAVVCETKANDERLPYTHVLDHHSRIKELEQQVEEMKREMQELDSLEDYEEGG